MVMYNEYESPLSVTCRYERGFLSFGCSAQLVFKSPFIGVRGLSSICQQYYSQFW
jgi:hypothetical protein